MPPDPVGHDERFRARPPQSLAVEAQAQLPRVQQREEDLLARHLRAPGAALREHDRHLDHRAAAPEDAVLELDQEGVAVGADAADPDALERRAPDELEAARTVAQR